MQISARALPKTGSKPMTLLVPEALAPEHEQDAICPRCRGPMNPARYATVSLANGLIERKRPSWQCRRCKLEIVSVSGIGRDGARVKTTDEQHDAETKVAGKVKLEG